MLRKLTDPTELGRLLDRTGLAVPPDVDRFRRAGTLLVNNTAADLTTGVRAGDAISLGGRLYRAEPVGPRERLQVVAAGDERRHTRGPVRAHSGFHKSLTIFSRRIYDWAVWPLVARPRGFRHFYHRLEAFYDRCEDYRVTSISGHVIDLDRFDDVRVVRVVRDPRDMIVSGYFYHRRAGEPWCALEDPVDADWAVVNGRVPAALPAGTSLAAWLNTVSPDEGLAAEVDFRRNHFETMRNWPDDPRVRTYRYEDIMGHERETFAEILDFLGLPPVSRWLGATYADRHSVSHSRRLSTHIRNPASGQWRDILPAAVVERVAAEYGDVLDRYGYPRR